MARDFLRTERNLVLARMARTEGRNERSVRKKKVTRGKRDFETMSGITNATDLFISDFL